MLRGHDADDDVGLFKYRWKIIAGADRIGDRTPGQKLFVDSILRDRIADLFLVRPQPNAVGAFASENDGKPRSPRSGSDDGDFAHLRPRENVGSAPESRRRMF